MRSSIVLGGLAVVVALLSGCADPAARLVGRWQMEIMAPPAADAPLADRIAYEFISAMKMEMEFKADGTVVFRGAIPGQTQDTTGKWKHVKTEGNSSRIEIDVASFGQKSEATITWLDGNTIEWSPPQVAGNTKPLKFKRVEQTP